ncbi:hypothetical protein QAD02_006930 [Eretmocerus hayati]|uniref:Uncharacterized protein n=1 Tax=Eretmocerus hayati TaxID=131215 RepID=A0ACC2N3I6_9HYME|nr:hypothetical protein QAD02_006930 [Eretmocerus hayati]
MDGLLGSLWQVFFMMIFFQGLRQVEQFSMCSHTRGLTLNCSLTFNFTDKCGLEVAEVVPNDIGTGTPYSCKDQASYEHTGWLQFFIKNTMNDKIVRSIAVEIGNEIKAFIADHIDCTALKPSKYHYN